jgi:outer membrane murein-binding lipoprotein Lpp
MQLKPIAVIVVLLLVVASLLVAGCTSSTNNNQAASSTSQAASSAATKTANTTTKASTSAKPSASASIISPTPNPTPTPVPMPQCNHVDIVVYYPSYGPCSQCISRYEGFRDFRDQNQPYVTLTSQTFPGTWDANTTRVYTTVRETGVVQNFDAKWSSGQMVAWATGAMGCPEAVPALPVGHS